MKKVAIVGVEGAGKTVMLAGLGALYSKPDSDGYFIDPENFKTDSYVTDKVVRLRQGKWPGGTPSDALQGMDWHLCRKTSPDEKPDVLCQFSCLDFGGEVYRAAFGVTKREDCVSEVEALKEHIDGADELVVLINLRDIITNGPRDERVKESVWITKEILSFALGRRKFRKPRVAIAITQADSYAETIRASNGPRGVLAKYLPHVFNTYSWLDVFALTAVDRTTLDAQGGVIPAPDFTFEGLRPLMTWIINAPKKRYGWKRMFCAIDYLKSLFIARHPSRAVRRGRIVLAILLLAAIAACAVSKGRSLAAEWRQKEQEEYLENLSKAKSVKKLVAQIDEAIESDKLYTQQFPEKAVKGARQAMCIDADEPIRLLMDTTGFFTTAGTEGFVITQNFIYGKDAGMLPWSEPLDTDWQAAADGDALCVLWRGSTIHRVQTGLDTRQTQMLAEIVNDWKNILREWIAKQNETKKLTSSGGRGQ